MSLQSRLASLISAIGSDIKSIQTQITSFSGGSDPWTYEAPAGSGGFIVTNNSSTFNSEPFVGFAPAANTKYIVEIVALVISGAATNGIRTQLAGPTSGVVRSAVKIVSAAAATVDKIDHLALNTYQAAINSLTTPHLIIIQAELDFDAVPGAGNVKMYIQPEVNGTSITMYPGSFMRWRTV